jgi:hypothetical protein
MTCSSKNTFCPTAQINNLKTDRSVGKLCSLDDQHNVVFPGLRQLSALSQIDRVTLPCQVPSLVVWLCIFIRPLRHSGPVKWFTKAVFWPSLRSSTGKHLNQVQMLTLGDKLQSARHTKAERKNLYRQSIISFSHHYFDRLRSEVLWSLLSDMQRS